MSTTRTYTYHFGDLPLAYQDAVFARVSGEVSWRHDSNSTDSMRIFHLWLRNGQSSFEIPLDDPLFDVVSRALRTELKTILNTSSKDPDLPPLSTIPYDQLDKSPDAEAQRAAD